MTDDSTFDVMDDEELTTPIPIPGGTANAKLITYDDDSEEELTDDSEFDVMDDEELTTPVPIPEYQEAVQSDVEGLLHKCPSLWRRLFFESCFRLRLLGSAVLWSSH
ncbi:unnamed protein product [Toxocara canis]|uniref:Uncharacterized protein n=1 Tax=Toxocara canis TaxID=6265 RepID=A0A3P7H236_TOXCA|nr:unnamed protein product [Toxocara canis]